MSGTGPAAARHDCQRMIANVLKYCSKDSNVHYSDHVVRELFRTSSCKGVWSDDADNELKGLRTRYEQYITPMRLHRVLDQQCTHLDRFIAQKAFERYNRDTNDILLQCFASAGFKKPFMRFMSEATIP